MYPAPNVTSVTSFLFYPNIVTGGWFWTMILAAIFIVLFIVGKIFTTERAFAVASFVTLLAAVILRAIDFIGDMPVFISVALAIFGMIALRVAGSKDF